MGSGPKPPLRARDFMASNPEHLEILKKMGVSLIHLKDGRVQLVQHAVQVRPDSTFFEHFSLLGGGRSKRLTSVFEMMSKCQ